MNIETTIQGIRISAMVKNHRVSRHYIGYTKKEARNEFMEEFGKDE